MGTVAVVSANGASVGEVTLVDALFGVEPNVNLMHQVVTAQLAARRAGTQSTKTRAEVRGGGKKPFKQKGTGNARQGSTNAPHWSGGGVALGPKPRSYAQRTPKKMIKAALASALSDRAALGKVLVVDSWGLDAPSTKSAVAALKAVGAEGKVLVVLRREDAAAAKSFRNLQDVHVIETGELNAYDVLCSDVVVFTQATLPTGKTTAAPYGAGSAAPPADGSAPVGFEIKGNADSMLYHVPGSRYYKATKAEAWFATAEDAERAGFSAPPSAKDEEGDES